MMWQNLHDMFSCLATITECLWRTDWQADGQANGNDLSILRVAVWMRACDANRHR